MWARAAAAAGLRLCWHAGPQPRLQEVKCCPAALTTAGCPQCKQLPGNGPSLAPAAWGNISAAQRDRSSGLERGGAAVLQVCPDTRTEPLLGHRIPFSTEGCALPQSVQGLPPTAEESAPVVRSNSEREPRASLKLQCVLSARAPRLCLAPLQDTEEHRGGTAPQRVPGSEFHQRR